MNEAAAARLRFSGFGPPRRRLSSRPQHPRETAMISYATIGSNDLDKAMAFYTDLLGSQGVVKLFDHPRGGGLFGKDGKPVLGVLKPFDGNTATAGNGSMVA